MNKIHWLEYGYEKAERKGLNRNIKHPPGAICGNGAWYQNYPNNFVRVKDKVTCPYCLEILRF